MSALQAHALAERNEDTPVSFLFVTTALPFSFFSGVRYGVVHAGRGSDVPVDARTRAGYISLLGEIPDKGGRGQECVTPGLPSPDEEEEEDSINLKR